MANKNLLIVYSEIIAEQQKIIHILMKELEETTPYAIASNWTPKKHSEFKKSKKKIERLNKKIEKILNGKSSTQDL